MYPRPPAQQRMKHQSPVCEAKTTSRGTLLAVQESFFLRVPKPHDSMGEPQAPAAAKLRARLCIGKYVLASSTTTRRIGPIKLIASKRARPSVSSAGGMFLSLYLHVLSCGGASGDVKLAQQAEHRDCVCVVPGPSPGPPRHAVRLLDAVLRLGLHLLADSGPPRRAPSWAWGCRLGTRVATPSTPGASRGHERRTKATKPGALPPCGLRIAAGPGRPGPGRPGPLHPPLPGGPCPPEGLRRLRASPLASPLASPACAPLTSMAAARRRLAEAESSAGARRAAHGSVHPMFIPKQVHAGRCRPRREARLFGLVRRFDLFVCLCVAVAHREGEVLPDEGRPGEGEARSLPPGEDSSLVSGCFLCVLVVPFIR